MLAMSFRQPFASLIAFGLTEFDERKWAPPQTVIGQRVALHASARPTWQEWAEAAGVEDAGRIGDALLGKLPPSGWDAQRMPTGMILGTAHLAGAYRISDQKRISGRVRLSGAVRGSAKLWEVQDDGFGEYAPGTWLLHFTDVKLLPVPMRAKGGLGFWDWEPPPVTAASESV